MKFEKMSYCAVIIGLAAVLVLGPPGYAETSDEKTSIKEVKQEAQDLIQLFCLTVQYEH